MYNKAITNVIWVFNVRCMMYYDNLFYFYCLISSVLLKSVSESINVSLQHRQNGLSYTPWLSSGDVKNDAFLCSDFLPVVEIPCPAAQNYMQ